MTSVPLPLPSPPDPQADWAWFLDVDGTLIHIAPTPSAISMPVWLPGLLTRLSERHGGALAVVSGRTLDNLGQLLAPFAGPAAGLHGIERRSPDGRVTRPAPDPALDQIRRRLHADIAPWQGVLLEDKGLGVALHYRNAPEREDECRRLAEAVVAAHSGFRLLSGKMVFELKPRGYDKGGALRAFMAEPPFAGRVPVFVGDDVTDEFGFEAANQMGGVSVLVGEPRATAARFRLPHVDACRAWLARAAGTEWRPDMEAGAD